jgi:glucans biosynthesis protein
VRLPLGGAGLAEDMPFDAANVRQAARELAQKPFVVPDTSLPDNIQNLDYDKYRKIRFIADKALWRNDGLPFQIQFFHRGFYFSNRVDVFEVAEGRARPIKYSPSLFNFEYVPPPPPDADLGFAGFRVHAAPTISTRLECFSVPVISVRSPRGRLQ